MNHDSGSHSPRLPLSASLGLPFALSLPLILALCLVFPSCHRDTSNENDNQSAEPWQAPEAPPVENSGKTLSGAYILKSLDDQYASKDRGALPALLYSFEKDGQFKREESSQGRLLSRVEGTYVIGTRGELVLYVEKVGDDQVAAALPERYKLEEQPDGSLKLQQASGATLTLTKR